MIEFEPPSESPEALLAAFIDRGDVSSLGRLFDRVSPELFRIALSFSWDASSAEDALQETWLTVLDVAPRWDRTRRVVPWLAGILRLKVLETRRRLAPHAASARVRPPVPVDGPDAAISGADDEARARGVIESLDEPYRAVALMRWRYGLEPAEIAHIRNEPPGTTRSLLSRALDRLRHALGGVPAAFGFGDAPRRGLAEIRAVVLSKAGAAGAAAGTGVVALGGLLVGKKILVASTLLLLFGGAGAVWWATRPSSEHVPAAAQMPSAPPAAGPSLAARERQAPAPTPAAAATGRAKAGPRTRPGRGELVAHVNWADGTAAAGIGVMVIDWSDPNPLLDRVLLVTGPDGSSQANDLRPGRVSLYADRGGGKSDEVTPSDISELPIVIPAGIAVDGRVTDENGPVAGAEVWWANDWYSMTLAARADGDGRFRLRDVGAGKMLSARAAGRPFSARQYVMGKSGETVSVTITLAGTAGAIVGHVTDGEGRPVPGAAVLAGQERASMVSMGDTQIVSPPAILATADDTGAFRIDGLPEGAVPVVARATGFAPWSAPSDGLAKVNGGEQTRVDIRLGRGATVSGTVTDEVGKPAAGAQVLVGEYASFGSSMTTVGEDGAYSLADLAPGSIALRAVSSPKGASREGGAPMRAEGTVNVAAGGAGRWDATLGAGLRILGRLLDEHGAPLAQHTVEGQEDGPQTAYRVQALTDADGRFSLTNCRDVRHLLTALAPAGPGSQIWPLARVHAVRPGPDDVVLRVREEDRATAHVVGTVIGPDGSPLDGTTVMFAHRRTRRGIPTRTEAGSGRFAVGPVPPGAYDVTVEAAGLGRVGFGTTDLRLGETRDLGRLELQPPGTLVVEVVLADGTPAGFATVLAAGEKATRAIRVEQGTARDALLPPGPYTLRVEGARYALTTEACAVVSGKETRVRVTVVPGAPRTLVFALPEGDRDANVATIRLRREADRATLFEGYVFRTVEDTFSLGETLAVGRYRAEAETDSGLTGAGTFDVNDLSRDPAGKIRFPLAR